MNDTVQNRHDCFVQSMTKSQSKNPEKLQATEDQLMKAKMKATILFF